ncbi:MAG: metallophosphoesterase [Caldithrix sp.]|nr:metallophosphoesterase [Caldithrix sp.]
MFFSAVILVYGSVNYYLYVRGAQSLPGDSRVKTIYTIVVIFLVISFLAGRILERYAVSFVSDALIWIGSFWLAAMVYFLLISLSIDILRAIDHFLPFIDRIFRQPLILKKYLFPTVIVLVILVVIGGHWNAAHPHIKKLDIQIAKESPIDSLRIVAASDIHLGTIVGRDRFCKYVEMINALNPDIILLPGDIVDEDLAPVIRQNLGQALTQLQATYGVFGITGNHEYIGGAERAARYLQDHSVTMLRDASVLIDSAFYVVGREDLSKTRFTGQKRKTLSELIARVDTQLPVILLDHQPFNLDQSVRNGIDLQLSGHTHNGQLWPFNYITNAIYEVSFGYKQKENSHFYVSCGVGTWGPPVRTSSRPEIVVLSVKFNKRNNP